MIQVARTISSSASFLGGFRAAVPGRAARFGSAGFDTQYPTAPRARAQDRIPSFAYSIRRTPLAKAADDQSPFLDACSVSRGVAQVSKSFVETPTDIVSAARSAARALVEREHRLTLSKMLAYERVAASIGASPGWLRKFVGGYEAKPDLIIGFNILAHYARVTAPRH